MSTGLCGNPGRDMLWFTNASYWGCVAGKDSLYRRWSSRLCIPPCVFLSCSSPIRNWLLLGAQACFFKLWIEEALQVRLYRRVIAAQFPALRDREQWWIDIGSWPWSFPISCTVLIFCTITTSTLPPPLPSSPSGASHLAFIKIKRLARHVRSISSYNSYENTINKLLLHPHDSTHMWLRESSILWLVVKWKMVHEPWI